MAVLLVLYCGGCHGEREFEQPPCVDGHETLCPEFACVECGMAVVLPWTEPVESAALGVEELREAG